MSARTAIASDEQLANVLSNLRWDLRLLRWHPYIDQGDRRRFVRAYIRDAIRRIRIYRAMKALKARKAVAAR